MEEKDLVPTKVTYKFCSELHRYEVRLPFVSTTRPPRNLASATQRLYRMRSKEQARGTYELYSAEIEALFTDGNGIAEKISQKEAEESCLYFMPHSGVQRYNVTTSR